MIDGSLKMTESVAMSQYIVDKYGPSKLEVGKTETNMGIILTGYIIRCHFNFSTNYLHEI